jgi:hypothetical protein
VVRRALEIDQEAVAGLGFFGPLPALGCSEPVQFGLTKV